MLLRPLKFVASLSLLTLLAPAAMSGCVLSINDDGETGSTSEATSAEATSAEATSAEATTGDGDGDGTTSGDGDGDGTTGDGDGDGTTGDGDGDGTTGDGDGDGTTGDGDGDGTTGDGDGDGDGAADCTPLGGDLVNAINAERAAMSLSPIPLSPSLCHVAQVHSQDLVDNEPDASSECNLHSWSNQGSWSACCYTSDHAEAACMWAKPGELTNYPDNGYEISAGGYPTVADAIDGWMNSPGHRDVILNANGWANSTWRGVGGGYVDGHWNVWFGEAADPGWP